MQLVPIVGKAEAMTAAAKSSRRDPNTLSNYDAFITKHTLVKFTIDFEHERLTGDVTLTLERVNGSSDDAIILDTSHLDVLDVHIGGIPAEWELLSRTEPYGSALKIKTETSIPGPNQGVAVNIKVRTTRDCTALQWLKLEQTSNKKHPYLFSQCQAIHARSVFPCQDTPDVKSTYEFYIRSPLPVLTSGLSTGVSHFKPGKDGLGTLLYSFKQDIPIPSYLFAIASGDIATAAIGPRSTVATGPEELSDAKWELEDDMEPFIQAAESILQTVPYAWTTYNVLVLPPSFPYGGMENPVFTFATPTIISGDRQNVDVIAHELSHSWSGNLVSNASWEHFWLNEGWTTYLERRIQAAVHGEPHRSFSAIIGWKALSESIDQFGKDHEFTKLVIDLKGKDPDDAFSSIPYEKGFTFLYHLENLIGKKKWDTFIPHYFSTYAQKSLTSQEFKDTLLNFFASDASASHLLQNLNWDTWFYAPGYPPKPDFDTSLADVCYELADKWNPKSPHSKRFQPSKEDIKGWMANQIVVFLEKVQEFENLGPHAIETMGKVYGFSQSRNAEVMSRYLRLGIRARYTDCYPAAAELLGRVGRMKFVRPLYTELRKADKQLAVATFEKNKGFYHPICRQMVEKILFGKYRGVA